MAWDAFKDFKYDPDSMGGFNEKSYTTDWNKDFGKYTDEAKGEDKGLEFLKRFKKGLSGINEYDSQKPYSFGGSGGGFNAFPIASDVTAFQSGGGQTHFIPGQKGGGGAIGSLLGTAASFIPGIGPGIAAALPSIGGTVGGMFG